MEKTNILQMVASPRDAAWTELMIIQKEMKGISPKVSTYAKLKIREQELLKRLGKIK